MAATATDDCGDDDDDDDCNNKEERGQHDVAVITSLPNETDRKPDKINSTFHGFKHRFLERLSILPDHALSCGNKIKALWNSIRSRLL